eukprot:GDKJ01015605.1.p1 GENE.GDKJ01015605.1~~GDKJ01015605.1.p1  ORF type:complete len:297 (+),score=97.80 GDKJ01015605.1:38-928(+)
MHLFQKLATGLKSEAATTAIKAVGTIGAAAAGLNYLYNEAMYNVPAGHAAVVYNRITGLSPDVHREGTHFKLPWFERATQYNVKTVFHQVPATTGSHDLQTVNLQIKIHYHPNPNKLPELHRNFGIDFADKIIPSVAFEVVKAKIANYYSTQLLTAREALSLEIKAEITKRFKEYNLVVDDFSITHLAFSKEYADAIEQKKVAEQMVERAKYLVFKAEQDKKGLIIKAEADGKAVELIGQAMQNNPGYIELKKLDIAKDIANIVARSHNKVMLDSSQLALNIFNFSVEAHTAPTSK